MEITRRRDLLIQKERKKDKNVIATLQLNWENVVLRGKNNENGKYLKHGKLFLENCAFIIGSRGWTSVTTQWPATE